MSDRYTPNAMASLELSLLPADPDAQKHHIDLAVAVGLNVRNLRTCEHCGDWLIRRDNECPAKFRIRKHCNRACANAATAAIRQTNREVLAEETEHLLSFGLSHEEVAARLGTNIGALARQLYRAERPDLAAPFERLRKHGERAKVCADCGAKCSHYQRGEVTRCRVCAQRARWAA